MKEQQETLSEEQLKVILRKNIFIAYISATMELAMWVKDDLNQKEKFIYNDAMKKLNRILSGFDAVTGMSPIHQHKVDLLMTYASDMVDMELKTIKKQQKAEGNE